MSALVESLLTAFTLSGLAAGCLVLLPRTPPRVRFAVAAAGLAAWLVPWGWLRIALPSELVAAPLTATLVIAGDLASLPIRPWLDAGTLLGYALAAAFAHRPRIVRRRLRGAAALCAPLARDQPARRRIALAAAARARARFPPRFASSRTATSPQPRATSRRRSGSATVTWESAGGSPSSTRCGTCAAAIRSGSHRSRPCAARTGGTRWSPTSLGRRFS